EAAIAAMPFRISRRLGFFSRPILSNRRPIFRAVFVEERERRIIVEPDRKESYPPHGVLSATGVVNREAVIHIGPADFRQAKYHVAVFTSHEIVAVTVQV